MAEIPYQYYHSCYKRVGCDFISFYISRSSRCVRTYCLLSVTLFHYSYSTFTHINTQAHLRTHTYTNIALVDRLLLIRPILPLDSSYISVELFFISLYLLQILEVRGLVIDICYLIYSTETTEVYEMHNLLNNSPCRVTDTSHTNSRLLKKIFPF